ncbi:MAG: flagellar protein FlaG [Calditrichia bacterium]
MEVYSVKDKHNPAGWSISSHSVKPPEQEQQQTMTHEAKANKPVNIEEEIIKVDYPKMFEIAREVGNKLKSAGVNIQFEVNESSNRIVIKVLDPVSGEVIRKIPPEAFLKSVENINEMKKSFQMQGIEIDVRY